MEGLKCEHLNTSNVNVNQTVFPKVPFGINDLNTSNVNVNLPYLYHLISMYIFI